MAIVFECIMLVCFGLSWPISVYKSIKSKSTKGKSVIFLFAIIIGYIAGIISKIVGNNIELPFFFYIFNLTVVSLDAVIFFINRKNEKALEKK